MPASQWSQGHLSKVAVVRGERLPKSGDLCAGEDGGCATARGAVFDPGCGVLDPVLTCFSHEWVLHAS